MEPITKTDREKHVEEVWAAATKVLAVLGKLPDKITQADVIAVVAGTWSHSNNLETRKLKLKYLTTYAQKMWPLYDKQTKKKKTNA